MGKTIDVYFVILPKVHILDLAGPVQVFYTSSGDRINFNVHYVGLTDSVESAQGLEIANLGPLPEKAPKNAIIVVPGISVKQTNLNDRYILKVAQWLHHTYQPSQTFCFVCAGAVLAAKAGLLKHRNCTTHHSILDKLQQFETTAKVKPDRIFIKDDNIYTCAGITAGIDLSLQLISDICGYRTALKTAREMVIYFRRTGSDPQLSFWLQHRNHIQPVVHQIQDQITQSPEAKINISILSQQYQMSARNLGRVFKNAAGLSITQFQQKVRIHLASELITNTHLNIDEIAAQVGYSSADRFRSAWRNWFDKAPSAFRQNTENYSS